MDCRNVSDYIIIKYNQKNQSITNLRLQKILYYVQGYFYKFFDVPAFDSDIYCWSYGPVVIDAYYQYNIHGNHDITIPENEHFEILNTINSKQYRDLINKVVEASMSLSVIQLVNKTHAESPWANSTRRSKISNGSIYSYFNKADPLRLLEN